MNQSLQAALLKIEQGDLLQFIPGIRRGIEKESLRVDNNDLIAKTKHPLLLGSSLTHPMITTDYSEALIELITPPTGSIEELFTILSELHHFVYQALESQNQNEFLWAASMPCELLAEDQIPIAQYGTSNLGRLKTVYRKGLGLRYSRTMQTIAGVHYNFSFSNDFWQAYFKLLQDQTQAKTNLTDFISEQYLGMIRNCMRLGFVLPLFFGASPALNANFLKGKNHDLEMLNQHTLIKEYATSLRLSDLGYQNKIKTNNFISINSFPLYLQTMHEAVHTREPEYTKIGVIKNGEYQQLSDCLLQTEDEHYALFRPKRVSGFGERTLAALINKGIEYIEVRALDLNPFHKLGIEPETVYFLDVFLLLCLLKPSPALTEADHQSIRANHLIVVNQGRKPGVKLTKTIGEECALVDFANEILEDMHGVALLLDKAYKTNKYSQVIEETKDKLMHMNKLPSAQVLSAIKNNEGNFIQFAKRYSRQHQLEFNNKPLEKNVYNTYNDISIKSTETQKQMEQTSSIPFADYLQKFLEV